MGQPTKKPLIDANATEVFEIETVEAIYMHVPVIELGLKSTAITNRKATLEKIKDGFKITSLETMKSVFIPNQNIRGVLLKQGIGKKPR